MDPKRRNTLKTIGAIGLGYAALRYGPALIPDRLEFTELQIIKGYRKFSVGESSRGQFDPFIGLDAQSNPEKMAEIEHANQRVLQDIEGALFAGLDPSQNHIPIASFSDYYCPFCRVLTKRLGAILLDSNNGISVAWHELPLLGDTSKMAARAALAAKRQGAYVAYHEHLMKSPFGATPKYLRLLSQTLNLDEARLVADMESQAVTDELETSAALARVFPLIGTPALVIGRTLVQGQISNGTLQRIIELEREDMLTRI